jgi:hypothetical protein
MEILATLGSAITYWTPYKLRIFQSKVSMAVMC